MQAWPQYAAQGTTPKQVDPRLARVAVEAMIQDYPRAEVWLGQPPNGPPALEVVYCRQHSPGVRNDRFFAPRALWLTLTVQGQTFGGGCTLRLHNRPISDCSATSRTEKIQGSLTASPAVGLPASLLTGTRSQAGDVTGTTRTQDHIHTQPLSK
jgi:hypothetical protein